MIKKALSLFLVLCLSLILFGCNDYKQITPSDEDMTIVGHVNGRDVCLDELRFVAYTYRDLMISRYGDGIFEGEDKDTYLSMLSDLVCKNITYGYAVIELCDEVGIGLGEKAIIDSVDKTLSDLVKNDLGSFSKYKKYLKQNHLTDRLLRFSTEISLLENELKYVYVDDLLLIENDDEKIYDIIKNDFIIVRHVFVPHSTEGANEKILSALDEYQSGASMDTLISKYNEDPSMTSDGIFILDGYMSEEYQDVAFSLSVGDVSQVVTDYNGYYIIERVAMSPSRIMLDFDNLKQTYQTYTFFAMIDQRQKSLSFVLNDAGIEYLADPFSK